MAENGVQNSAQEEQERMILDAVERFLERDVQPYAMELEHNDTYPEDIVEKMKELGLFGSIIEEQYGGLGLSCLTYAKIVERVSRVWMSIRISSWRRPCNAAAPRSRSGNGCRNLPAGKFAAASR